MDRVRDDFFAGSRLAHDEDAGIRVRDHLDFFEQPLHARRFADQMPEGTHLLQLTAELEDLLLHHLFVFDRLQDHLQARQVDRLGHVVFGADFESFDRRVDSRVPGQNDHRDVRIGFLDFVEEIEAGAIRKLEIDDRDIGNELGNRGPARLHGVGGLDFVTPLLNHVGHAGAGSAIIVDDQYAFHWSPRGSDNRNVTLSRSCTASSSPPYVSTMRRAAARERSGLPAGSV